MIDVIGMGAGGHAKVVIEALRLTGAWNIVGLLDTDENLLDTSVAGVPVLGGDEQLDQLAASGVRHAFVGVGASPSTRVRRTLFATLKHAGFGIVDTIHPRAFIAPSAKIGEGFTALAGAVINTDAVLGDNVIVNTGAIVEHDCVIGDHVHVASRATLTGGVTVGHGAFVGAGACVSPQVQIGPGAVIGAGAVVVGDVATETVVVGVPARVLRILEAV
jgi:UDP-perosamine 4-acetyltransferase